MSGPAKSSPPSPPRLTKCPTGIHGLDDITGGGLPRGRPTLIRGGAGSGKPLLGMEFLIRGIQQFDEHGVLNSFDERASDLTENVASLGYDLTEVAAAIGQQTPVASGHAISRTALAREREQARGSQESGNDGANR